MKYFKKKIAAASIQYVLVISVIILIVLSAFISLIYMQNRMSQKGMLYKETVHHTNLAFDYLNSIALPYDTQTQLAFSDHEYEETTLEKTHWGVFDVVKVRSKLRNEVFQKTALMGSQDSTRPALYLKERNNPLILVGNASIKGRAFLPNKGIHTGNIGGVPFYGSKLIDGTSQQSSTVLPEIKNLLFLKELSRYKEFKDAEEMMLEEGMQKEQSFDALTLRYNQEEAINLQQITLKGNIVITSETSITVHSSAVLEHCILIAPKIYIESNVQGSFQAIASQKIRVGKSAKLKYPSALLVLKEATFQQQEDPLIELSEQVHLEGVIVYEDSQNTTDYKVQMYIGTASVITGEVYCTHNLELKGRVQGTVFTSNFIVRAHGNVYANYIYDGNIDATALPVQYGGLFLNSTKNSVAKWVY